MDRPMKVIECGECDEPLRPEHPAVPYDGEWCHLHCAALAMDSVGFDDFFGDS